VDVNRYGYSPLGLFIPYALACLFTFITVVIGATTYARHGVMPGKELQDILAAADSSAIDVAKDPDSRHRSLTEVVLFPDSGGRSLIVEDDTSEELSLKH
jgi:hypothetical protein